MANENEVKLDSYVPDNAPKKRKTDTDDWNSDFSIDVFLSLLLRCCVATLAYTFVQQKLVSNGISDVGSINPVQDFKEMLARRDIDLVEKGVQTYCCITGSHLLFFFVAAVDQMKQRILQLVNDSIRDQFYPKAIECVVALRSGCILVILASYTFRCA